MTAVDCFRLLQLLDRGDAASPQAVGVYAAVAGDLVAVCAGAGDAAARAEALRSGRRIERGGRAYLPVDFDGRRVGVLELPAAAAGADGLAARIAPLLLGAGRDGVVARNLRVLEWVRRARDIAPAVCDWTGVYYKASFALGETGTDLVLGPFLGAPTPHLRIPIDRGICGLALREERTVNVADVRADARYLACSAQTRSELVVPLAAAGGELVAELDIDSHRADAFGRGLEERFLAFARSFAGCL